MLIMCEMYLLLLLLCAGILGLFVYTQLNVCLSSCRFIQEAGYEIVVTAELKICHYFY